MSCSIRTTLVRKRPHLADVAPLVIPENALSSYPPISELSSSAAKGGNGLEWLSENWQQQRLGEDDESNSRRWSTPPDGLASLKTGQPIDFSDEPVASVHAVSPPI